MHLRRFCVALLTIVTCCAQAQQYIPAPYPGDYQLQVKPSPISQLGADQDSLRALLGVTLVVERYGLYGERLHFLDVHGRCMRTQEVRMAGTDTMLFSETRFIYGDAGQLLSRTVRSKNQMNQDSASYDSLRQLMAYKAWWHRVRGRRWWRGTKVSSHVTYYGAEGALRVLVDRRAGRFYFLDSAGRTVKSMVEYQTDSVFIEQDVGGMCHARHWLKMRTDSAPVELAVNTYNKGRLVKVDQKLLAWEYNYRAALEAYSVVPIDSLMDAPRWQSAAVTTYEYNEQGQLQRTCVVGRTQSCTCRGYLPNGLLESVVDYRQSEYWPTTYTYYYEPIPYVKPPRKKRKRWKWH